MITFISWKWQAPNYRHAYTAEHVNVWAASVARNCDEKHRIICVTDDPTGVKCETFPLWGDCDKLTNPSGRHLPSCYRRLKIFDPWTTAEMDIDEGSRVVSQDLDIVVVKKLDPLFAFDEPFMGWYGEGAHHPKVYNGSLFMFQAGRMAHLWDEFDPARTPMETVNARFFGSDQGWLSYRLRGSAPGWTPYEGVMSYSRDMLRSERDLPRHARIVSFNGKTKPWDPGVAEKSPWIKKHWRL